MKNYRSETEEIFVLKKTYIGGIGGTSSLIGIGFNLLPKDNGRDTTSMLLTSETINVKNGCRPGL